MKNNQLSEENFNLEIIDENNKKLGEIKNTTGNWNEITSTNTGNNLDQDTISQFNHCLSLFPSAATARAGNSSKLMTCSFAYEQLKQAKDGTGAIGAVPNETGKIKAQARFQEAKKVKSLVNATLVFNIVSQALAQKHLADINERLNIIGQKIDKIQKHLEQSRSSKIEAFYEFLRVNGQLIADRKSISECTLQSISEGAREMCTEITHLKNDIDSARKEIEEFNPKSWFGSNDIREKLNEKIENISRLNREYILGVQSVLIAYLTLYIKKGGSDDFFSLSRARIEDFSEIASTWGGTKATIKRHLLNMKPFFELARSTHANTLQIENKVNSANNSFYDQKKRIENLYKNIQSAQSPRFILEVVDGQVRRGRLLD